MRPANGISTTFIKNACSGMAVRSFESTKLTRVTAWIPVEAFSDALGTDKRILKVEVHVGDLRECGKRAPFAAMRAWSHLR